MDDMDECMIVDAAVIEKSKLKYKQLYEGSGKICVSGICPGSHGNNQIVRKDNKEEDFKCLLSDYNASASLAAGGLDNVPNVTFSFGGVAYLMAIAYGAPVVELNGIVSAEPLFQEADAAEGFKGREHIYQYGLYPEIISRLTEFQEMYPQIPIGISDNQSPINVLTSILHSEAAILAMYDSPELIHRMLQIVTDSIIEYNLHLAEIAKNFKGFTAQHFSHLHRGMQISDDNAAFLSPSIYSEFAAPYAERLAETFGGVNFHCCMGYAHNLKTIAHIPGFLGFDPQVDYNDIDMILDAVEGHGVWMVNNTAPQKKADRTETDMETFMRAIDKSEGRCGLNICVWGNTPQETLELGMSVKEYAAKKGRLA